MSPAVSGGEVRIRHGVSPEGDGWKAVTVVELKAGVRVQERHVYESAPFASESAAETASLTAARSVREALAEAGHRVVCR